VVFPGGGVTVPVTSGPRSGVLAVTLLASGSVLTGSVSISDDGPQVGLISGTLNGPQALLGVATTAGVQCQFNGTIAPAGDKITGTYTATGGDMGNFTLSVSPTPGVDFSTLGTPPPPSLDLSGNPWFGTFSTTTGSGSNGSISLSQVTQDQAGFLDAESSVLNGAPFTFCVLNGSVTTTPIFFQLVDKYGSHGAMVFTVDSLAPVASGSNQTTMSGTYTTVGGSAAPEAGTFTLTH
jgi:hypothetical protein